MLPVLELSQEQKMSIQPQDTYAIPEDTRRVAHAAFPKGNLYMRMRDELGELYHDQQFAELFPRRGQTALAINRLSTALARAEALSARHLAAQIRLWLVPLLPPAEARASLAEARAIAESGGRRRLLEEVSRLEEQLGFC
jgi:uncharacterized protein YciW